MHSLWLESQILFMKYRFSYRRLACRIGTSDTSPLSKSASDGNATAVYTALRAGIGSSVVSNITYVSLKRDQVCTESTPAPTTAITGTFRSTASSSYLNVNSLE